MASEHRATGPETRTVSASALRQELAEALNRVAYGEETLVIERKGRPLAALISYEEFQIFQRMVLREGL